MSSTQTTEKQQSQLPHNAPVTDDHVFDDLPCYNCNYNLRTLHINNNCPECGHHVLRSIHQNAPYDTISPWLQKINIATYFFFGSFAILSLILLIVITNSSNSLFPILFLLLCLAITSITASFLFATRHKSAPTSIVKYPPSHLLRILTILLPIAISIGILCIISTSIGRHYADINKILTLPQPELEGRVQSYIIQNIIENLLLITLPFLWLVCFLLLAIRISSTINRKTLKKACKFIFSISLTVFTLLFFSWLLLISTIYYESIQTNTPITNMLISEIYRDHPNPHQFSTPVVFAYQLTITFTWTFFIWQLLAVLITAIAFKCTLSNLTRHPIPLPPNP